MRERIIVLMYLLPKEDKETIGIKEGLEKEKK